MVSQFELIEQAIVDGREAIARKTEGRLSALARSNVTEPTDKIYTD